MAADRITVRTEGVAEAQAALDRVLRAKAGATLQYLDQLGALVVGEVVKGRRPWLTGTLLRSYVWSAFTERGGAVLEVGSSLEYAPYQELGTRHIAGTPHLVPGVQRAVRQADALATRIIGGAS
jgi:hypothetical protein